MFHLLFTKDKYYQYSGWNSKRYIIRELSKKEFDFLLEKYFQKNNIFFGNLNKMI